jgi:hypothetical protein
MNEATAVRTGIVELHRPVIGVRLKLDATIS